VEGFNEVATLATIYNFPYYPTHMERLGYKKDIDWVEYEMTVTPEPDPTIARIADIARRRYKLHLLEARNKKELVTIQAVIARAFSARSNLVLNRKNHALGDCFTRKKRSFAVTPLFRVDG